MLSLNHLVLSSYLVCHLLEKRDHFFWYKAQHRCSINTPEGHIREDSNDVVLKGSSRSKLLYNRLQKTSPSPLTF